MISREIAVAARTPTSLRPSLPRDRGVTLPNIADVLAAAILRDAVEPPPPPPPIRDEAAIAADCVVLCARQVASQVAGRTELTWDEAWAEMLQVPNNLLSLLASPEGWAALAQYIASTSGVPLTPVLPTYQ